MWVEKPSPAAPTVHRLSFLSHSGQFSLNWGRYELRPPGRYGTGFVHEERRPPIQFWWRSGSGLDTFWNLRGFFLLDSSVSVPAWFAALASGAAAVLALRPWRLRGLRRATPGRCPACGYDLRATPDRCPECGTTP
jgi:hypothetical protein